MILFSSGISSGISTCVYTCVSFFTESTTPSPHNLFSILLLYFLHSKYHKIIDDTNNIIIPDDNNVIIVPIDHLIDTVKQFGRPIENKQPPNQSKGHLITPAQLINYKRIMNEKFDEAGEVFKHYMEQEYPI